MRKIIIQTIPDGEQRYNTVGDYYTNQDGHRIFSVSDMNNWKYEILVTIHELIESTLCQNRNITDNEIDLFDIAFEEKKRLGEKDGEPGDDANAPYFNEHQFATKIEKMLATELGVDWETYNQTCKRLDQQ